MEELKLYSPWVIYANQVQALFELDGEVEVEYDNDGPKLTIRVENAIKADAISKLFPAEVKFGNVTLQIEVIPANVDEDVATLMANAFYGNPAFLDVLENTYPDGRTFTYVLFQPQVTSYDDDGLNHLDGCSVELYHQIAEKVFKDIVPAGVFFDTLYKVGE